LGQKGLQNIDIYISGVFLKYQDIGKLSSTEHWVGSIFFSFLSKNRDKDRSRGKSLGKGKLYKLILKTTA
jgi:hypothetical protein